MPSDLIKLSVFIPLLLSPLVGNTQSDNATDPVMEELLSMDLAALGQLQVYTASRELTSIEKAPSVVTVITAEQIARQGLKSLYEVLARVPGFFNATSPFMELISNRGFVQNVNTNYLLLVDGHTFNNDAVDGVGHLHMMPGLDRIDHIEIVRGPGSTLWGADAAMGIIHLITKSAEEFDTSNNGMGTLKLSYDYEFDHQRNVVQANYGKHFGKGSVMLSGSFLNSAPDWTTSYQAGATDFAVQTSRQMNLFDYEDSYDLYAKLALQGWMLKAGKINFEHYSPFQSPIDGSSVSTWTTKKEWVELGKEHEIGANFSLEWKVYHNSFVEQRFTRILSAVDTVGSFTEEGVGGETILHYRDTNHHLLVGASASSIDITHETIDYHANGTVSVTPGISAITDNNKALFIENSYRGFEDWVFTLGLRVDRNEPRSNSTNYMPRFAVSNLIDETWSIKYAYNTGYVAPTFLQGRGGQGLEFWGGGYNKGADRNQESHAHDLQLFYKDDQTHASLTLFHHTLKNVIQWSGFGPISIAGFNNVTLLEVNASDVVTWGLELEANTRLTNRLGVYGNYTFAHAEYQNRYTTEGGQVVLDILSGSSVATDDLTVTGTPKHILNLGLDWDIRNNLVFNIHYRGWTDAWAKRTTAPSFQRYGPYHYFDLNLRQRDFLAKDLTLSAYIKNIFDNVDPLPGGVNDGQVVPQNGRQLGVKMSYRF